MLLLTADVEKIAELASLKLGSTLLDSKRSPMDKKRSPKVTLGHKRSKKVTPIEIYLGHFGSF